MLNTGQRIGSAVGSAVIGTILFGSLQLAGRQDLARAYVHSALPAGVAMVLVALALIFALLRRLKHAWQG